MRRLTLGDLQRKSTKCCIQCRKPNILKTLFLHQSALGTVVIVIIYRLKMNWSVEYVLYFLSSCNNYRWCHVFHTHTHTHTRQANDRIMRNDVMSNVKSKNFFVLCLRGPGATLQYTYTVSTHVYRIQSFYSYIGACIALFMFIYLCQTGFSYILNHSNYIYLPK